MQRFRVRWLGPVASTSDHLLTIFAKDLALKYSIKVLIVLQRLDISSSFSRRLAYTNLISTKFFAVARLLHTAAVRIALIALIALIAHLLPENLKTYWLIRLLLLFLLLLLSVVIVFGR